MGGDLGEVHDVEFQEPLSNDPSSIDIWGQLLLRLRDPRHRWLRVHENGDLEVAIGDARRDEHRTYLGTLAQAEPLLAQARELHAELRHNFQADSLLERSVWDHFTRCRRSPVCRTRSSKATSASSVKWERQPMSSDFAMRGTREKVTAHCKLCWISFPMTKKDDRGTDASRWM